MSCIVLYCCNVSFHCVHSLKKSLTSWWETFNKIQLQMMPPNHLCWLRPLVGFEATIFYIYWAFWISHMHHFVELTIYCIIHEICLFMKISHIEYKFLYWGILNYADSLCILKISPIFYIANANPYLTGSSMPQ